MDYKAYALITILLTSLALAAPIGISYATTTTATTNATGGAATNATGGGWRTFDLTVGNQTQPIQYMITNGSIQNMTINGQNSTLGVSISSTGDGTLVIRLPRNILDAKADGG